MARKILVIDNDNAVLDIMQEALNYEGFEVVTSPKADNCEYLIRQHEIDLVIIDYLLEGINGGEVCHQLKTSPELRHLPVIIFSAYPKVLESIGRYGCDRFIPKPFDLADIVNQITMLLQCNTNNFFSANNDMSN